MLLSRRAAAAATLGLVVLTGCGSTIDGTAQAAPGALTTSAPPETTRAPSTTTEQDETTTRAATTTEAPPATDAPPFDPGPLTITDRRTTGGLASDLCALLTAEEVGAALGGTSEPLGDGAFVCTLSVGESFALLSNSAPDEGTPVPAATQVGGNTTLEVRTDEQTCEVVVALNADPGSDPDFLDAYVLSTSVDPCAAALALVSAAFPRTPA